MKWKTRNITLRSLDPFVAAVLAIEILLLLAVTWSQLQR